MTTFSRQKTIFVVIFLLSLYHITYAQFLHIDCPTRFGNYNQSSDYETNINSAITQLVSLASTSHFNKISVGNGSDKVNALFYCRYDVSSNVCQGCVQSTLEKVPRCYRRVKAILFYQECTLHYSNATIFSIMEDFPQYFKTSSYHKVDDGGIFTQLVSTTITSLIGATVSEFSVSSRYFATSAVDYSVLETLYALAQCNEDITSTDCKKCLQNGFDNLRYKYPTEFLAQVFKPSCSLSYKLSSPSMSKPYDFTYSPRPRSPTTPKRSAEKSGATTLIPMRVGFAFWILMMAVGIQNNIVAL